MNSASRQRSGEQRRRQAAERREAELRRERRRRILTVGGVVLAVLIVLGVFITLGVSSKSSPTATPTQIPGVRTFPGLERSHTTTKVTYPQTPPVGGPHAPVWLNCGIYEQAVPNENGVHNLEHGTVWITYRPDLPASEVTALQAVVREQGDYVNLSPFPGVPSAITASAWGAQLNLDSARDPRLRQFVTSYRLSPSSPEPGAPCTGGVGAPKA